MYHEMTSFTYPLASVAMTRSTVIFPEHYVCLVGRKQAPAIGEMTMETFLGSRHVAAPESISWRLTHSFSVCGTQPIFGAIDSMAAHCEGYSPRCACTMRTARSRISGENLFDLVMAQSSQSIGPPPKAGRLILSQVRSECVAEGANIEIVDRIESIIRGECQRQFEMALTVRPTMTGHPNPG